jgi:hypothetical protein
MASGVCPALTTRFDDLQDQSISSHSGTFEFRVKLLKDISQDPHNHVLMLGVSRDSAESFEIQIIQDQLIVHRRFGHCVLTAFVYSGPLKPGDWHSMKLIWNGESSRFYIDQKEVKKLGLYSSGDLPKMLPGIRLGMEDNFRIEQFQASAFGNIPVDPADQAFVKNVVCTDLKQLIRERPQEEYRGIALRHFPDQLSRDKIKSYIGLLPEGFAGAIKHIVFVEDTRFLKGGEGGFADPDSGSLVLKGSLYDDPTVFFHEAAHLYDYQSKINFGVPDQQSEWATISGASCYFKGARMDEFYKDFQKNKDKNGFLGAQGGQCASEDLAIWVGAAYDYYLKGKTFSDRLNLSSPRYSPKSQKKLDFILRKGFISQEVYDQLTRSK